MGYQDPTSPYTWFLGSTRHHNPNGISIDSTVFTGLDHYCDRPTDRPRYSVGDNSPHVANAAMMPKKFKNVKT